MPHQKCSLCFGDPKKVAAVNQQIPLIRKGVTSVRKVAKQEGVHHATLFRHIQHVSIDDDSLTSNPDKSIRTEIRKLRQAQTAAKKRRDTNAALAISREIRAWMALESKAQIGVTKDGAKGEELPRSEALALAMAIIETELNSPDVIAWIDEIHTRIAHIVTPVTPAAEVQSDE